MEAGAVDLCRTTAPTFLSRPGGPSDVCADGGAVWAHCDLPANEYQERQRGPQNYGPARQVFMRPFAIVVGSGGSAVDRALWLELGRYISLAHWAAVGSYAPVVLDTELGEHEDRNLVLLGGPRYNGVLRHALETSASAWPPVTFQSDDAGATVGYRLAASCEHTGPSLGLGFVVPLPSPGVESGAEPRLALVLDGTDATGLRNLVSFSYSSNQPLTRAAFTNMFPDFVLVGPEFESKGYGGVLAAGFWGHDWSWSSATSFTAWC